MSRFGQRAFEFWYRSSGYAFIGFYSYGLHDNLKYYKYDTTSVSVRTLKILGLSLGIGITGLIWPVSLPVLGYTAFKSN